MNTSNSSKAHRPTGESTSHTSSSQHDGGKHRLCAQFGRCEGHDTYSRRDEPNGTSGAVRGEYVSQAIQEWGTKLSESEGVR